MLRAKGVLYAVTAAILWGTLGPVYIVGESMGASGEWMAIGRPLLPALVSLGLLLLGYGRLSSSSILVGIILGVFIPVYLKAVEYAGAALASILLYTAPIWVTAAGSLLGEKPGPKGLAAVLMGVVGVSLTVGLGGEAYTTLPGLAYGLGSGLLYAAYIVFVRAAAQRGASVLELGLHSQPVAAVAALLVLRPSRPPSTLDLLFMMYTGVVTMMIPYLLNVKALSILEAHRVSVLSLIEPLTATLLAVLVLGESLAPIQVVGAALVLGAAFLTAWDRI